jgi:hypothetical protein
MNAKTRLMRTVGAVATVWLCGCARSIARTYEQSYLAADYNWSFREHFPQAERLFNGFDYGHAILYETLITRTDAAPRLESREFDFITTSVLRPRPTFRSKKPRSAPTT